ncbi:MAG: zf-HC2 domain-containing protein, partial [Ktedonobacterales bacterium]
MGALHWQRMSQDEALAAYSAGELDATTHDAFACHLAQCASCQQALTAVQTIRALLRPLAAQQPDMPAVSLADAILAQLPQSDATPNTAEQAEAPSTVPATLPVAPVSSAPVRPLSPSGGVLELVA